MDFNPSYHFAEAQACIRCGACMEVCPLYQLSGKESMVARGKLSLLQALTDETLAPSRRFNEILEFCLLCGACADKCTAKIPTPQLVKAGRALLHDRLGQRWSPALTLAYLSLHTDKIWPTARAAGPLLDRLRAWVGGSSGLLYRLWPALSGLAGKLPQVTREPFSRLAPSRVTGRGKQTIAFFVGCGVEALFPQAGLALLKICQQLEVAVIIPDGQGCCGLLAASAGEVKTAQDLGRGFVRQFHSLPVDYIVTACASCSYHLKQLPTLFPAGRDREAAALLAGKVREASAYLAETGKTASLRFPGPGRGQSLVFHDPCHLRLGQQITEQPRQLLGTVPGVELLKPEAALQCCGQGGIFGICHPETAKTMGDNALSSYRQTGATTVVTACSGCLAQLSSLAPEDMRVRHFLEILADAL